ncbi:hypothetical protein [uncultured Clostridium sp.]|uniref:hypothetical protein n=1 Tax=uncultured Clostridium sp. TaxID=59620 RepID=UPI0026121F67|nr:hypothetical protein [uncultured Clostridium sp.]
MTIAVQIIAIIFMLTLMFIGIWSFVIANKAYNQFKYKNYLLEKIANQLALLTENSLSKNEEKKIIDKEEIKPDVTVETFVMTDEILEFTKELQDVPPIFELEKEI